ncbi:MAG: hypothetical protein AAGM22_29345 [Acidobacteriota bacterium]
MPTDLPPPRPPEPPADQGAGVRAFRGVQGAILFVSLGALLALFILPFLVPEGGRGRPWKVAISETRFVTVGDIDAYRQELIKESFGETSDRLLAARQGLLAERISDTPRAGISDLKEADEALRQSALEAEYGEILTLDLQCQVESCLALLRRLRTLDGAPEWRRSFRFQADDLVRAAEELAAEVHIAYLKFSRRSDGARLLADAETYESYLRTIVDHRRGSVSSGKALSALEDLRQQAPRFLDLHLLEAELRAQAGDKTGAAEALAAAQRIAPGDVRPALRRLPILVELGRDAEAEEALSILEELLPGEPRLLTWREHVAK